MVTRLVWIGKKGPTSKSEDVLTILFLYYEFIATWKRKYVYLLLFWLIHLSLFTYALSNDPPYLQSSNWTTYCLRPNLQVICTAYLSLSARLFPPIICWSYSLQHGNDGWIFTSYKCMLKLLLTARKWWVNAFYLHQFCSIFQIVYLFLMERRSPPQPLG